MQNKILYKAETRGHADHGWLKSSHTFSFANYRNNDRINFGVLRVLNDDYVAPDMGFGMHHHENMEIVSIPLSGSLSHQDNLGNSSIITTGEIQVMSAGTGVEHSEFNPSTTEASEFLQIWIFPKQLQVTPRYEQKKIAANTAPNQWQLILSPQPTEEAVWIHQNAWFNLATVAEGQELNYTLQDKSNGVFIFVLEGSLSAGEDTLDRRDAIGLWEIAEFKINAKTESKVLVMEIPMELPAYLK